MKRRPKPIQYKPLNPSKYVGNINEIVMRSSWESRLAFWLDTHQKVIKWGSEIKHILYYSKIDKKIRRYFPDFWAIIEQKDGTQKKYIIEVKPHSEIIKPVDTGNKGFKEAIITWQRNQDKWESARAFALKHGFEFVVMDEYTLGIKKK
jgi:hypothetical protein